MAPLLTICTIAYNQEKFIAQTLEGFVSQRADFEFEAIVADDCSTDSTAKIIAGYAEKYQGIIKPALRDKNIGMTDNFSDILRRATGRYIALCDGDDYWTDPLKLQKQADFLEANPEYAICFHPVEVLTTEGKTVDDFMTRDVPETTDIYDLAKRHYIHTPSVVFRNNPGAIRDFASLKAPYGDYVLHMLNAQYGKIKKLPGSMAVYRQGVGVVTLYSPAYWHTTRYMVLHLLCGYFDDKNRTVHGFLVQTKNGIAANGMRTFFQADNGKGALDFFNGMDNNSKKDLLKYLTTAEGSLVGIHSSRGWRFLQTLYRLGDIFMPAGSRRRRYAEKSLQFLYRSLSHERKSR